MKSQTYMDRAMRSKDRRYVTILDKLGYGRIEMTVDALDHDGDGRKGGSPKPDQTADLAALREEYQRVVGKRPFHGWDAEELRARIAATPTSAD